MMNKIRERLSWDADRTILLVQFILATAIAVGLVWYERTHPYNGESEVLNRLIADATKSEGPPATAWETITVMVMGPLYFVLSVTVLLLPLVVFLATRVGHFCGDGLVGFARLEKQSDRSQQ